MRYLAILSALIITGCSTVVPVTVNFPDPPDLASACGDLKKLTSDTKISDVSRTIADNYAAYHDCAIRVETWNEWYSRQRAIFNRAGK